MPVLGEEMASLLFSRRDKKLSVSLSAASGELDMVSLVLWGHSAHVLWYMK